VSSLDLSWLGRPTIKLNGAPVELETRKATALLAYLSLTLHSHPREVLAALFWPEYDPDRALGNLRRVLWAINRQLTPAGQPAWLVADREAIALVMSPDLKIDVVEFENLLKSPDHLPDNPGAYSSEDLAKLEQAAGLVRGDFLEGLNLRDCPEFDEWQYLQRDQLRQKLTWALSQLAAAYAAQSAGERAIAYARRWVALDRLNEPAQETLIRLYVRTGQRGAALRQYEEYARLLRDELGQKPDAITLALYAEIRGRTPSPVKENADSQAQGVEMPAPRPAPSGGYQPVEKNIPHSSPVVETSAVPIHLPKPPTPFVGRNQEVGEILHQLMDPNCRLLTLLGPGGIGKTRLAIQAAYEASQMLNGTFAQGIYFVPLAPLDSPEYFVQAVANGVGFVFNEDKDPKQLLLDYLVGKNILLVLDNIEHLLAGVELLNDILDTSSQVKLLVTSRERLNLAAEWIYEVEGMHYPGLEDLDHLEDYSSVRLFLQSARRAMFGYELARGDRPALARICRLVEGMPLGLELAASWVRSLPLAEIASEIEENLDFLATNRRDLPARHQSLRAVFERSWNLLSEEEQRVFPRLSAFRGSFNRQAAQAVTGASLLLLTSLADKSLIKMIRPGRFELHELLRQFAREKLSLAPEDQETILTQHSRYYLGFMAERSEALSEHQMVATLAEISEELENVRAAWNWATSHKMLDAIGPALDAVATFYMIKTFIHEARSVMGQALEGLQADFEEKIFPDRQLSIWYGSLLDYYASFCFQTYRIDEGKTTIRKAIKIFRKWGARREQALSNLLLTSYAYQKTMPAFEVLVDKSLKTLRELGTPRDVIWALQNLAEIKGALAKDQEARDLYMEALDIARRCGNLAAEAEIIGSLGTIEEWTGNLTEARNYYAAALPVVREIGFRWAESLMLDRLGYVCRMLEEYEIAIDHHQKSLVISREHGDSLGVAGSYDNLGLVFYDMGKTVQARQYAEDALQIRRNVSEIWNIAVSLENLASIDLAEGKLEEAGQKLEESLAIHRRIGHGYGLGRSLARWGFLKSMQGNFQEAADYFYECLEVCSAAKAWPLVLTGVIGLACLESASSDAGQSMTWLRFSIDHPSTYNEDRKRARACLTDLESRSTPGEISESHHQAAGLTLADVVDQLESKKAFRTRRSKDQV